jgi:hypothetical protein
MWSLTSPHTPQGSDSGRSTSIEEGKAALLAAWRRWQDWAGMRDAD